ncbi:MAG: EAL domain-containing protein [Candidatus Thiodiazotropha sp. (ex Lucinoma kastoroae)]|nr:EAL domain-containing protein [Candidatus Thiodiazotropha sp. (ex Lucinoma kastoroae)]
MGLNRKILLVTIGTLALSLLISSVVNVLSFRSNYTDALLTGSFGIGHSIESILNELLALGLPLESLSGMDEKLTEVAEKNPHIVYAGVTDSTGLMLFHNEQALVGRKFTDPVTIKGLSAPEPLWQIHHRFDGQLYYDVAIPIFDEGRHVGVVRLGFPIKVIDEKVMEAVRQILINVILTFFIIALLLNLFLRRHVVEPVKKLSQYAASIANGRFEQPVRIQSKDEVGKLSRALRDMGATIKEQIDALRRSGLELEEKVEVRTQELADANQTLQASNLDLKQTLEREKQLSEALRLSEERFRMLYEGNKAVMLSIDPHDGRIFAANNAAVDYYGYTMDELLSMKISDINTLSEDEVAHELRQAELDEQNHFHFCHTLASGEIRDVEVHSGPYKWNGRQVLYSIVHDVTDRKKAEAELELIAHYDSLTGLPNRLLKTDRLRQAIAHSKRNGTCVGVCYLDLDGFKPINDRYGHDIGDLILIEIGQRLKNTLRDEDTVSRIGGDEFALILTSLPDLDECRLILDRVLAAIAKPIILEEFVFEVNASIGLTLFPEDDVDAEILMRHADHAMYVAKEAGKNRYHLFDPERDKQVKANRENYKLIEQALANQEFILYYQPKVDMYTCEVVGVEALIRWMHPEKGITSPGDFLSYITGTDVEIELGKWVIDHALQQMAQWHEKRFNFPVSVNISAHHLQHPDFINQVRAICAAHPDVSPDMLELEILETTSIEDMSDIYHTLVACREMGIKLSLDDFGTGYSSLAYFHRLPVDTLKIDQSFVQDMLEDPQDLTIVDSVVRLAHAFQHPVIAEGVESIEHGAALLQLGCRLGQGYGIARPMPAEDLPQWLELWKCDEQWQSLKIKLEQSQSIDIDVALFSHQNWLDNLIGFITLDRPLVSNLLGSQQCSFSHWFYGIGFVQYGHLPLFERIKVLHEQIHQLGNNLISMTNADKKEHALLHVAELETICSEFVEQIENLRGINDEVLCEDVLDLRVDAQ